MSKTPEQDQPVLVQPNPAERLYNFVKKARGQGDVTPPAKFWGNVFDLQTPADIAKAPFLEVAEYLGQFLKLTNDVEAGFRELDLEPFYFEPFKPLRKVVHTSVMGLGTTVPSLRNTKPI